MGRMCDTHGTEEKSIQRVYGEIYKKNAVCKTHVYMEG